MKNSLYIIVCVVFVLVFGACSNDEATNKDATRPLTVNEVKILMQKCAKNNQTKGCERLWQEPKSAKPKNVLQSNPLSYPPLPPRITYKELQALSAKCKETNKTEDCNKAINIEVTKEDMKNFLEAIPAIPDNISKPNATDTKDMPNIPTMPDDIR